MKLRIRENTLRFRLTKSEVEKIKNEGLVEEQTDFAEGNELVYAISVSAESESLKASFIDGRIEVVIPQRVALNWTETAEVGIYETSGKLKVVIEKDFTCLTPRTGDEDRDTFPHPQKEHSSNC